jgi:HAD superfamily hydrolase (TIGR01549 family)
MPIWQIHRAIGIGSDRVVEMLAGEQVEQELGEALRAAEGPLHQEMIGELEPMTGAHELLRDLKHAGHTVIPASSAEEKDAERYIDLLDAKEFVDGYTTSADVKESKPEPDIVNAAIKKAGGGPAVMIGDSTWDCKAATSAELPSIGVLTGGFSEQELTEAGATIVFTPLNSSVSTSTRRPFRTPSAPSGLLTCLGREVVLSGHPQAEPEARAGRRRVRGCRSRRGERRRCQVNSGG